MRRRRGHLGPLPPGKPYAVDCASSPLSPGATCVEDTMGGYPVCGYGSCSGTAVACDHGTLATCNDGVAQRMPCASLGEACTTTSGGACVGTGADCTGAEARCDGNLYVECNGGHEESYDRGQVPIPSTCVVGQSILAEKRRLVVGLEVRPVLRGDTPAKRAVHTSPRSRAFSRVARLASTLL